MRNSAPQKYPKTTTCIATRKFERRSAANLTLLLFLWFFLSSMPAKAQMWISGYYVDTSLYMSDVPFSKLTHAIHFSMHPSDSNGNISGIPGANADAFTAAAHAAGTKAILCLGDNNGSSSLFTASMSNNPLAFIYNVANFVNTHNYDGVDLDWEAGSFKGQDQINYIYLINGLRNALGPNKSISIAVYWNNGLENVVRGSASSLNQVNIMCYDMDQWRNSTFYNAAIYAAPGDTTSGSCAAEAAQFSAYIAPGKIGLGIPFYGRITSGCADAGCSEGLHDATQAWSGNASLQTLQYKDLITSPYWSYPHGWDSVRGSSYISVDQPGAGNDRFISYTDSQQINSLVQLAKSKGYGGVMEFEVEYDFVASQTGDARHPLAAATFAAVGGTQPISTQTTAPAPYPVIAPSAPAVIAPSAPTVTTDSTSTYRIYQAPPVLSSGTPYGTIDGGTPQATMTVTTNVTATCRYALTANTPYSSMPNKFSRTGGSLHSTVLNITSGTAYGYYVRCSDSFGNANPDDFPIKFATGQ